MSPRRRRPRAPAVARLLLLGALAACGPEAGEDARAPAGAAPRRIVRERVLDWTWRAAPSAGAAPLSRSWDLGDAQTAWRPSAGRAARREGALVLRGDDRVALDGPIGEPVDTRLHQWLVVQVRTAHDARLRLQWAGEGEELDEDRAHDRLVPAGPEPSVVRLRLDALRGIEHGATAAQGVARFRVSLLPADPQSARPVEAAFEEITLFSEYDVPPERTPQITRLGRDGVYRRGLVLRAPASVTTTVSPGDHEELAAWVAVAGRGARARVVARVEDGAGAPVGRTLDGEDPWTPLSLDLSAHAGREATLIVEASPLGEAPAVVLLGGPLRLAEARNPGDSALLYVVDTLRADHLGVYGYPHETAPALSALAEKGATFTRCFATSNWTRPAVATMLTGLLPSHHGNDDFADRIVDDAVPLAQVLADAGLLTASFVTNFQAGAWSGLDRGFDVVYEPGAFARIPDGSTMTSTTIAPVLDAFLTRHAGTRLFAYVQSIDPHAPYLPREEDVEALAGDGPRAVDPAVGEELREQVARETLAYDAEIRNNDRELGALLERIEALGLDDSLCLMVASDHGEQFAEHGRLRHRQGLYQEEVHVPWIVRHEGRVAPGLRVDEPVTQLDMPPTLLGLLGVPAPPSWQGRDLSGLLTGAGGRVPPAPLYADDTNAPGRREVAVVDWPYKLIAKVPREGPPRPLELYDLEADPDERADLLSVGARGPGGPDAERLARMLAGLAEYVEAQRATRRAAGTGEAAMDPAVAAQMRALGYLGEDGH